MQRDAVGPAEFGERGSPHRVGLVGAAGLTERRYVIDIDAEKGHAMMIRVEGNADYSEPRALPAIGPRTERSPRHLGMDPLRWITVAALTLLLFEGFALSLFPEQIRRLLTESDPRSLQMAGLFETTVGAALLIALLLS